MERNLHIAVHVAAELTGKVQELGGVGGELVAEFDHSADQSHFASGWSGPHFVCLPLLAAPGAHLSLLSDEAVLQLSTASAHLSQKHFVSAQQRLQTEQRFFQSQPPPQFPQPTHILFKAHHLFLRSRTLPQPQNIRQRHVSGPRVQEGVKIGAVPEGVEEEEADLGDVGVGEGVSPPPVELHLLLEVVPAAVGQPLTAGSILSHRKNYSSSQQNALSFRCCQRLNS